MGLFFTGLVILLGTIILKTKGASVLYELFMEGIAGQQDDEEVIELVKMELERSCTKKHLIKMESADNMDRLELAVKCAIHRVLDRLISIVCVIYIVCTLVALIRTLI